MQLNEKLQELRKQRGLTQEELASALYVSRTAVSKWESGRGVPGIDSLKALSAFFGVAVDDLLSGSDLLNLASEDTKRQSERFGDLTFGLLDLCALLLYFLPFFAQKSDDIVQEVSLLSLQPVTPHLKIVYVTLVALIAVFGVMTLALQNNRSAVWLKSKRTVSLLLTAAGTLLFTVSLQPYAAVFLFVLAFIKGILLLKRR